MLGLSSSYKYFIFNGTVSMRKGIVGLSAVVREQMGEAPANPNNVYIFMSENRRIVKILHYERGCYVLYEKRPLYGKFKKPVFDSKTKKYQISWDDIVCLTEDIVVSEIKFKKVG